MLIKCDKCLRVHDVGKSKDFECKCHVPFFRQEVNMFYICKYCGQKVDYGRQSLKEAMKIHERSCKKPVITKQESKQSISTKIREKDKFEVEK